MPQLLCIVGQRLNLMHLSHIARWLYKAMNTRKFVGQLWYNTPNFITRDAEEAALFKAA